jgi:hypothetical protein
VITDEAIKLLGRIQSARVYFEGTQYQKIIESAQTAANSGHSKRATAILSSLPTDQQLLSQLVEKLKGKSVYTTLEKIQSEKAVGDYTALKGLSSLLTHALIECEKGATEFKKLIPVILEKLNTTVFKIMSERNVSNGSDFQRLLKQTQQIDESSEDYAMSFYNKQEEVESRDSGWYVSLLPLTHRKGEWIAIARWKFVAGPFTNREEATGKKQELRKAYGKSTGLQIHVERK